MPLVVSCMTNWCLKRRRKGIEDFHPKNMFKLDQIGVKLFKLAPFLGSCMTNWCLRRRREGTEDLLPKHVP